MDRTTIIISFCGTVFFIASLKLFINISHLKSGYRRVPGPSGLPIIGNLLQMPVTSPWLLFAEWGKSYGDLIQLNVLGKPLIIINSAAVAKELLDKRSSIYSDRPHFEMGCNLQGVVTLQYGCDTDHDPPRVGFNRIFTMLPCGDAWKKQRKLVVQGFNGMHAPRYYSLQENEAQKLIKNLVIEPSTLNSEINLRVGAIIFRVIYGYHIQSGEDPMLKLPLSVMEFFSRSTVPGTYLVDLIPAMKYLPKWIPGTGFQQIASKWRKITFEAFWNPYQWSKNNFETGAVHTPNLCASIINQADGKLQGDAESQLVWACAGVLGGGLDTNMSSALTFFLAMILYPNIQAKAQAEIDTVIGNDRLPTISDRESLPYIRSIVTEIFRWHPAAPLCLPHALNKDDVYNHMHLLKGSLILANVWNMLHDPKEYPNPLEFLPERYSGLDSAMQKVTDIAFGFGRRRCPGIHFAEGTLYAIVLTTLAACNVLPPVDKHGQEISPIVKYSSGVISTPEHFDLRLEYRSNRAVQLLMDADAVTQLDAE